jgi:hypothetical protein
MSKSKSKLKMTSTETKRNTRRSRWKKTGQGNLADYAHIVLQRCLSDDWRASIWTKLSAIADLTKGPYDNRKKFFDVVLVLGAGF